MSQPTPDNPSASDQGPSEPLPEVKPPTAGFILQLFVIPGMIVFAIIMVWLLVGSIADGGGDPHSYLAEMKRGRANRWQAGKALADYINRHEDIRWDAVLAKDIAGYLDTLLDQPLPTGKEEATDGNKENRNLRSEEVQMRGFLCRALGEMYVAEDSLPVLLKAAATPGTEDDPVRIRVAALNAIAILAGNLGTIKDTDPLDEEKVLPTIIAATDDKLPVFRSLGAFTLGVIGSEKAMERLEEMVDEQQPPEVRHNIATALARNGNLKSVDLLLDMLDASQLAEDKVENRQVRNLQLQVLYTALEASSQLYYQRDKQHDERIRQAIEKLHSNESLPETIRDKANLVLNPKTEKTG